VLPAAAAAASGAPIVATSMTCGVCVRSRRPANGGERPVLWLCMCGGRDASVGPGWNRSRRGLIGLLHHDARQTALHTGKQRTRIAARLGFSVGGFSAYPSKRASDASYGGDGIRPHSHHPPPQSIEFERGSIESINLMSEDGLGWASGSFFGGLDGPAVQSPTAHHHPMHAMRFHPMPSIPCQPTS
jgi:hypothetical protein